MADVTTYQVRYRRIGTTTWTEYGEPTTNLNQALTGLQPNQTYQMQVIATNPEGAVASQIVNVSTNASVPAPPGAPAVSAITATSVVLNWSTSPSGSLPIAYQPLFRIHNVGGYNAFGSPLSGTSVTLTGLTGSTSYDFEIVAANSAGSATSGVTTASTLAAGSAPSAPSGLALSSIQQTQMTLTWTASSGTAPITYQPQYRAHGAVNWINVPASPITGTSQTFTGLTAGTSYDFEVVATNTVGSATSIVLTGSTAAANVAPGVPGTPVASAITTSSMTLTWTASATGTTPITYQPQYRVTGTATFANFGAAISGLTVNLTSLTASTSYDFQVVASNSAGTATSGIGSATTVAASVAPAAPTGLATSSITQTSLSLRWTASASGTTPITYTPQFRITGSGSPFTNGAATTTVSQNLTNLIPNNMYDLQVLATNSAGSATSSVITATMLAAATTWDPANTTGTEFNLSNGNLTLNSKATAQGGSISTASRAGSKWYVEVTPTLATATQRVGFANATAPLTSVFGSTADSVAIDPSGNVLIAGASVGKGPSWVANSAISLALDEVNSKLFYQVNGAGYGTAPAGAVAGSQSVGGGTPYAHIVICVEENRAYSQIVGDTVNAPYINNLMASSAVFTNFFAITHPSEPNYFAMYAGSTFGIADDNDYSEPDPSLYTTLNAAGKTFKGYIETASPRKHNPWESFPEGTSVEADFSTFPTNFATLPDVSFVVPDLADDMHDGTITQGDTWLQSHLDSYIQWAKTNNSLFILTWDEDDSGGNNQILTLMAGARVNAGSYNASLNHYSTLATVCDYKGATRIRNAVGAAAYPAAAVAAPSGPVIIGPASAHLPLSRTLALTGISVSDAIWPHGGTAALNVLAGPSAGESGTQEVGTAGAGPVIDGPASAHVPLTRTFALTGVTVSDTIWPHGGTAALNVGCTNGTVSMTLGGVAVAGAGTNSISLSDTDANLQAMVQTLTYTAPSSGTSDSVTVNVFDQNGASNTLTIPITLDSNSAGGTVSMTLGGAAVAGSGTSAIQVNDTDVNIQAMIQTISYTAPGTGASDIATVEVWDQLGQHIMLTIPIRLDSTNDPANNIGGFDLVTLNAGPYFLAYSDSSNGDSVTADFGATPVAFTPPTGFFTWDGLASAPPQNMAAPSVASVTSSSATVRWTAPTTGALPLTYQPLYRVHGAASFVLFGAPISLLNATITGLTAGTNYDFAVTASNASGSTTSPVTSALTSSAAVLPGQVGGTQSTGGNPNVTGPQIGSVLVGQSLYVTGITLADTTWPTASNNTLAVSCTNGTVKMQVGGSNVAGSGTKTISYVSTPGNLQTAAASLVYTAPASGTADSIVVKLTDQGSASASITIQLTLAALSSGAPTSDFTVSLGTIATTSIALTWTAPSSPSTGTINYAPQYRVSGTVPWTVTSQTTARSATITGLNSATAYDFQVAASNTAGIGYSNIISGTTNQQQVVNITLPGDTAGTTAARIADLMELFGVNTFSSTSSTSNTWGTFPSDYSQQSVINALNFLTAGSGLVCNVREYHYAGKEQWQATWCPAVHNATGALFTMAIGANGSDSDVASMMDMGASSSTSTGWMRWAEGNNEPNNNFGSGTVPAATTVTVQQDIFSRCQNTNSAAFPVAAVGPSLIFGLPNPETGGPLAGYLNSTQLSQVAAAMSFINVHFYPSANPDVDDNAGRGGEFDDVKVGLNNFWGTKPQLVTEWHPTLFISDGTHKTDAYDAYYAPMFLLNASRLGYVSAFWFALYDWQEPTQSGYMKVGLWPNNFGQTPRSVANTMAAMYKLTGDLAVAFPAIGGVLDNNGDVWTITSGGVVNRNGAAAGTTSNAIEVALGTNGTIYYQSSGTSQWSAWNGSTWASTTAPTIAGSLTKHTFTPSKLNLTVNGLPAASSGAPNAGGHHRIFQNSSGTFFDFVWNEQTAISNTTAPISYTSGSPLKSVTEYNLTGTTPTTAVQTLSNVSSWSSTLDTSVRLFVLQYGGTAASGTGPAATSNFIIADFTNLTSPAGVANVVVAPELFGVATGGMQNVVGSNNPYSVVSNTTFQGLVAALKLPLLRLHGQWYTGRASDILPFAQNVTNLIPSTCTLVIGCNNNNTQAQAKSISDYWVANGAAAHPCNYWEVGNEPGGSESAYQSNMFSPCSAGFRQTNSAFKVGGPVWAGDPGGSFWSSFIGANNSSTLGFLDFHDYLYCQGPDATPTDSAMCQALFGSSDRFGGNILDVQGATKGTYAASYPILWGEYNTECGAGSDLRAGTSIGAAFLVSALMKSVQQSTQPIWGGIWDLYDDTGANYNLIDTSMNVYPQYYTLQRLIATMPGNMVHTTIGSAGGGLSAWATKKGTSIGVAIVNSNASAVSGQVALSHWPVNSTGNGTVNVWTYPTNTSVVRNVPGTVKSVTVTNGLTASITIPALSVAILSP